MKLRKAVVDDSRSILEMIHELAEFEKAKDKVDLSLDQFVKDGFGEKALFEAIIIEEDDQNVGFSLFYNRYSTWKGKSLYLEDLYIKPAYRGRGFGKEVMLYLSKLSKETKCRRFEWQVLDWNTGAINFYKSLGAELDSEWVNCRIERELK